MKRVRVKIYGLVQGVGFRGFVWRNANKLGINGWVKNLADGSVEALFEGSEEKIKEMIKICKRGNFWSRVERIEVKEEEFKNEFKDFKILY